MADLVPHPFVTRVGLRLGEKDVGMLRGPANALVAADATEQNSTTAEPTAEEEAAAEWARAVRESDEDDKNREEKIELAATLADQANVLDLSLFAGFLGGKIERNGTSWWVLYLDFRLQNWLIVPDEEIVVWERLDDENAPSGKRDALWVNTTASVMSGGGSQAIEGRFVVGEFTRAGDFAASTRGGTFSAATGLLCEATTPGCCWGSRTR